MATYNFHAFIQKADTIFRKKFEGYGYSREEVKINEIGGRIWSVHLIYVNALADLRIVIKQEPYYTDYGFSIFINKLGANQYNILYNVPHEKQDKENGYLAIGCEEIFSTTEIIDLISGKSWKILGYIPFLK